MSWSQRIVTRILPDGEYHQNHYARALADLVHEGTRWLDIGSGHSLHGGWKATSPEILADRAGYLIGCDLVPDDLRSNPALTDRVAASANSLPFAQESFDLVTANMVLEHLPDPRSALAEIRRVLAPGGRFLFVTPNRWNPLTWMASTFLSAGWRSRVAQWLDGRSEKDIFPTFYRANSRRALGRLAALAGFQVERVAGLPGLPLLRKPAPAVCLEALWIRSTYAPALESFRGELLGLFRRDQDARGGQ